MLKEERRQAFLSAMGIEVFYPRQPLPGAKRSPVYELPLKTARQSVPQSRPVSAGKPAVKAAAASQLSAVRRSLQPQDSKAIAGDTGQSSVSTAPIAPVEQAATSATDAMTIESLRFQLQYWQVSPRLSVLLETLPANSELQSELPTLLVAILQALGQPEPKSSEQFRWPLHDSMPQSESGAAQASQALSGFIAKRRERDGFANLLVFGNLLTDLLPGAASQGEASDYALDDTLTITRTHSLGALLRVPALKRETWAQLQALRQRLQSDK